MKKIKQHKNKYEKIVNIFEKQNQKTYGRSDSIPFINKISPVWNYDSSQDSFGSGYYLERSEGILMAPAIAEEIFNYHNYKRQRDFRPALASQLSDQITTAVNIAFAIGPDNYPVLVNGQHTLYAIFLKGVPVKASVSFYQCRDEKAIGDLYAIFDNGKNRTEKEIFTAANIDIGISNEELKKWRRAAEVAENGFRKPDAITNSEKLKWAKRAYIQEFAKWSQDIIQEGNKHNSRIVRMLTPQGVQASMFALWSSDKVQGREFMLSYLIGEGLKVGSSIMSLRERMQERPGAHTIVELQKHVGYFYRAWNMWNRNELSTIKYFRYVPIHNVPKFNQWKIMGSDLCFSNEESYIVDSAQVVD